MRSLLTAPDHAVAFEVAPEPAAVGPARDLVRQTLERHGVDPAVIADLVLVVSELVSNSVQAGPTDPVRVQLVVSSTGVQLVVANAHTGKTIPPREQWRPASPLSNRGRGLAIVAQLTDEVGVAEDDSGTRVICVRNF